jgi:hypothetical protein
LTEVELGSYQLGIATDFGPRIVSLRRDNGPELLARLDNSHAIDHPGGVYRFHGGHRLWAAPERPEITYANDDHACKVKVEEAKVTVTAPPDSAGLTKSVVISRDEDTLLLEHTITGVPGTPELAAWAITQFPLGGVAIVPVTGGDTRPRPNRNIALWPYTRLDDPRLRFGEAVAVVTADDGPPLKLGTGPAPQRLGHFREGWLFMKEVGSSPRKTVPDFGAVNQIYLGQGFCELESVGGIVDVGREPASISERWRVVACDDENAALDLVLGGET